MLFLSTLSLRRATRWHMGAYRLPMISIHALLAESDCRTRFITSTNCAFLSTLSLRRATTDTSLASSLLRFLSTLSLRRATGEGPITSEDLKYFYPRSPCGERRNARPDIRQLGVISIHALLAESDSLTLIIGFLGRVFLSTLSLRRATWVLMGGSNCDGNFYPRSPCGERRSAAFSYRESSNFYPRSPCGERLFLSLLVKLRT